ncbi:Fe-S cluster assembly ATPase SufC [Magnetococcus sp. PR-3]|uniref:Fe-S cluster assembly ATPase SufC n=1 Tax=Magnetococcus sp. PR-3 TaxID=3120355 RepID=UPI002FCE623E
MLEICNLHASVAGKKILHGVDLMIPDGQVHVIMGPNGSGKSTLAHVLSGHPGYEQQRGTIRMNGEAIEQLEPEERALRGLFLAFQYPVEIPGVNNLQLLKAALNARRRFRGEPELDAYDFQERVEQALSRVSMDEQMLGRGVNSGFSGGEKKRNEIFYMALLEPSVAILDETDSGLDIDALKDIALGLESLRDAHRSMLLITHYQRLLDYIQPDRVHVLSGGRIIRSGDASLPMELEQHGYTGMQGDTPDSALTEVGRHPS